MNARKLKWPKCEGSAPLTRTRAFNGTQAGTQAQPVEFISETPERCERDRNGARGTALEPGPRRLGSFGSKAHRLARQWCCEHPRWRHIANGFGHCTGNSGHSLYSRRKARTHNYRKGSMRTIGVISNRTVHAPCWETDQDVNHRCVIAPCVVGCFPATSKLKSLRGVKTSQGFFSAPSLRQQAVRDVSKSFHNVVCSPRFQTWNEGVFLCRKISARNRKAAAKC